MTWAVPLGGCQVESKYPSIPMAPAFQSGTPFRSLLALMESVDCWPLVSDSIQILGGVPTSITAVPGVIDVSVASSLTTDAIGFRSPVITIRDEGLAVADSGSEEFGGGKWMLR